MERLIIILTVNGNKRHFSDGRVFHFWTQGKYKISKKSCILELNRDSYGGILVAI